MNLYNFEFKTYMGNKHPKVKMKKKTLRGSLKLQLVINEETLARLEPAERHIARFAVIKGLFNVSIGESFPREFAVGTHFPCRH